MDFLSLLLIAVALIVGGILGRLSGSRSVGIDLKPVALTSRNGGGTALVLFDLDGLTAVNKDHDFDTGDRLLNAVEDVLRRALPPGAALERQEGGRLLIWTPDTDLETAIEMSERLRALAALVQVEGAGSPVARTLSAGIVSTTCDESRTRSIVRADLALANAKRAGGNRSHAVRHEPVPTVVPSRAVVAQAVTTGALLYHVQPIVRLSDRHVVGVESLLRWNRPDGAVLGPGGFLDTLNRLPDQGIDMLPGVAIEAAAPFVRGPAPIYATFNIAGPLLDEVDGPGSAWMREVMAALPPENLVFELVETAIITAPERALNLITDLRSKGVRIALDDFGTGLSNFERLRRYPVDILKIDRSFITDLEKSNTDEAILRSMVSLAQDMNIDLVAEGIETEAQAQMLQVLGVKYGQGYHLGRPAPAAEWMEKLALPA